MKKRIITKEEFVFSVSKSLALSDVIANLKMPENGTSRAVIKTIAANFGADISHLNSDAKRVCRIKYPKIEKICPACEKKFSTKSGDPREKKFCSHLCSNKAMARPKTEEEKQKIRDGVNKALKDSGRISATVDHRVKFNCPVCNNEKYVIKHSKRLTCSRTCLAKYRPHIDALRARALARVNNGTHSGWKSRRGRPTSYPEKFFMKVLENNNIKYERELLCNKYFIDFAIRDKLIALEIDGKQHEYIDRKRSDELKDIALKNNGWKVYRIKWKSINNPNGKIYIEEEINKFLEFYRSVA